ncbi:hypothetical protein E8L99_10260 [Phreatobacter aquaticus]|uniref:PRC-barrel domain-containing protein n=1 Tax=Phreatobacter aquaticus TaxID=2570229 RepID=A0A4D7QL64_9HYPH|nr:PRC-barrel domain-containing protein [Phreatobacter aquaticus]QCK86106.1 hypothetical protein E8L99_10260 [Phreatobacter aquaticus]
MNRLFITTALTLSLVGGAFAQTATPAAPTAAARASTTLGLTDVTSSSILGVAIYSPKSVMSAGGTPMPRPVNASAVTPAPAAPALMSDADFQAMRDSHDNIGDVTNFVMSTDGRISHVVLGVGGFLGIGEKSVAVAWTEIRWMRDSKGKLFGIVQRTKDQLQSAPNFVDRT